MTKSEGSRHDWGSHRRIWPLTGPVVGGDDYGREIVSRNGQYRLPARSAAGGSLERPWAGGDCYFMVDVVAHWRGNPWAFSSVGRSGRERRVRPCAGKTSYSSTVVDIVGATAEVRQPSLWQVQRQKGRCRTSNDVH